jgi:hypothetical protein
MAKGIKTNGTDASLIFEAQFWSATGKMSGHLDASESRTLAARRDALLPKLLSSELLAPIVAKLVQARHE